MRVRIVASIAALGALACARGLPSAADPPQRPPAKYLFAWTGDEDRADDDFLTVIDLTPNGDRYGTVVATAPVGEKGLWPHHTEHELGAGKMLLANGFSANRSMLFDLHDPMHPKVVERFNGNADWSFLHSFARLPNGHVLATYQSHSVENVGPGGLIELDEVGAVVRFTSSADSTADATALRPYSLAVVPELDRVVVAMTYMTIPAWHPLRKSIEHDHNGNQVQVFRLSDLSLMNTIKLPSADGPNEPRVLSDHRTVLVSTGACTLYRVDDLASRQPALRLVYADSTTGCAMPVVLGDFWVVARPNDHQVVTLDVHDLAHVRQVGLVQLDDRQRPHWIATDGARIVVVNEPNPQSERRMWMLTFTARSGRIALDSAFRDAGNLRPGIAFDRASWPHGATGNAVPHGTVFGW